MEKQIIWPERGDIYPDGWIGGSDEVGRNDEGAWPPGGTDRGI